MNIRIDLDAAAENVGLATMLKDLLLQNLAENPHKVPDFRRLRIPIGLTVPDAELALTLAFDAAGLTVYQGIRGTPGLDITADAETVMNLSNVRIKWGLPYYFDAAGREVLAAMKQGRLQIRGMLRHFPSLIRLSRIMSVHP